MIHIKPVAAGRFTCRKGAGGGGCPTAVCAPLSIGPLLQLRFQAGSFASCFLSVGGRELRAHASGADKLVLVGSARNGMIRFSRLTSTLAPTAVR